MKKNPKSKSYQHFLYYIFFVLSPENMQNDLSCSSLSSPYCPHPHPQNLGHCDFFLYYFHARHALNSACERTHSFPAEQGVVLPKDQPSSYPPLTKVQPCRCCPMCKLPYEFSCHDCFSLNWGLYFSSGIPYLPTDNTPSCSRRWILCHCGMPLESDRKTDQTNHCLFFLTSETCSY